MNKRIIITVIGILLICAAVVFFVYKNSNGVPKEVNDLITNYMEACKTGTHKSIEYMHFEDDFRRQAYLDSPGKLYRYEIESIEKINKNLYAITAMIESDTSRIAHGEGLHRVYNFAVRIDGKWYYLNGVAHIPEDLRENLDPSKYTYNDDRIVDPGDIISGEPIVIG